MNIHEYQAKELLAKFGVPVPAGYAAMSVEEAVAAAGEASRAALCGEGADPCRRARQGQVQGTGPRRQGRRAAGEDARRGPRRRHRDARQHAGHDPDRRRRASRSTGSTSPTASTSPRNSTSRCWSTAKTGRIAIVVSTEGGMDIEDVAHDTPEKIHTFTIDPGDRLHAASRPRGRLRARPRRAISPSRRRRSRKLLYDAFVGTDAAQIEINPLAVTDDGQLLVLDAKVGFDSQRDVPPPRSRGAARRDRGGSDGARGVEVRPRLHQARRQYRLHGQRRRPRHGDDGHHQAERRVPGQFLRRRRRRLARRR